MYLHPGDAEGDATSRRDPMYLHGGDVEGDATSRRDPMYLHVDAESDATTTQ